MAGALQIIMLEGAGHAGAGHFACTTLVREMAPVATGRGNAGCNRAGLGQVE